MEPAFGQLTSELDAQSASVGVRRYERKYFLNLSDRELALDFLASRLPYGQLEPGARFNSIESIYFDSERLDLFRKHFSSPGRRFKIRTRRYGPNGAWTSDHVMLELKAKEGKLTTKSRIRIGSGHLERLLEGRAMTLLPEIRELNPELGADGFQLRAHTLNHIFSTLSLRPSCRITFRRHAFEKPGLRVTIDEEVRCEILGPIRAEIARHIQGGSIYRAAFGMSRRFDPERLMVCEVKHNAAVPAWLSQFIMERMERATGESHWDQDERFSKYCFAVAGALDERAA